MLQPLNLSCQPCHKIILYLSEAAVITVEAIIMVIMEDTMEGIMAITEVITGMGIMAASGEALESAGGIMESSIPVRKDMVQLWGVA